MLHADWVHGGQQAAAALFPCCILFLVLLKVPPIRQAIGSQLWYLSKMTACPFPF